MTTQADTNAAVRKREECLEDERAFNDALCGRNSGSDRYSAKRQHADDQKRKQAEKQRLTALEMLLLDAEYRAAWQNAMNAINRAREAVNDALARAKTELEAAQQAHNLLMENAATFGDEAVFLDEDGYFYTMDGERLSDDDMLLVNVPENPTMRTAIEASADRLASAQERYAFVSGKDQELLTMEAKTSNSDAPVTSMDQLNEMVDEARKIELSIDQRPRGHTQLQISTSTVQAPDLIF
tara:strand:- start:665 stop:1384 length:720 start_codon:yes stop_codon:yes gene_type:complete